MASRGQALWIGFLLAGLLGAGLVWSATTWGPGLIDWDSFNYLASAESLASGQGLTFALSPEERAPLTHYPPLLPVLIAIPVRFGLEPQLAVRALNILLFGLSTLLFGRLLLDAATPRWALAGATLFALSPVLVEAYSYALAEGLLTALTLAWLWFGLRYFQSGRTGDLISAAVLAGLAGMAKYVGAAQMAALALAALVRPESGWRRGRDATLAVLPGLAAATAWAARSLRLTQELYNRSLGFYPLTRGNLIAAFRTAAGWFIPDPVVTGREKLLLGIGLLAAAGGLAWLIRTGHLNRRRVEGLFRQPGFNLGLLSVVFIAVYFAAVFTAKTFLDPKIGMQDRMFVPVFAAGLLLVLLGLGHLWASGGQSGRIVSLLALLYLGVYLGLQTLVWTNLAHQRGLGLNRQAMHHSGAVAYLQAHPEDPAYTDNPYAYTLVFGRPAYRLNRLDREKPPNDAVLAIFGDPGRYPFLEKTGVVDLYPNERALRIYRFANSGSGSDP